MKGGKFLGRGSGFKLHKKTYIILFGIIILIYNLPKKNNIFKKENKIINFMIFFLIIFLTDRYFKENNLQEI